VERNHSRKTGRYNINKTTPTRWWRKRKTAGTNVTKTAGRVERNHSRTTAGRYNKKQDNTNTLVEKTKNSRGKRNQNSRTSGT
jgi:hypothetical protein